MNDINKITEIFKESKKERLLLEMAVTVGVTEDSYLIYVNSDDSGYIPHFHYVDETSRGRDKKKGFHTCIRLDKPEYFHHTGKEGTLNSKQLKELIEFLNSPFSKPKFNGTNWDYMVMIWNMNNSKQNVDEDMNIPDYSKLKETK